MYHFDITAIASFLGTMLGSGGFLKFIIFRHDKKVEAEKKEKEKKLAIQQESIRQKEKYNSTLIQNLVDMSCATAQERIRYLVRQYKTINQITIADKEIIKEMYKPYTALGHNHYAEASIKILDGIPVVIQYDEKAEEFLKYKL